MTKDENQKPRGGTTSPRANLLLQWLMASSPYSVTNFFDQSIDEIRETLFRAASLFLSIVPLPVLIISWFQENLVMMWVNLAFATIMAIHSWLLLTRNVRIVTPMVWLILAISLYLVTIAFGYDYLVYWGYTFAGSIYLFLKKRQARLVLFFWLVTTGVLGYASLPAKHCIHFAGSLVITALIVEFLYSILYRQELRLRQFAVRDPLTNAYNRRALMDILDEALIMSTRFQTPSSILMVDIDWFKSINDEFGHREGDTVLANMVRVLSGRLRRSDKICRYGGEEFVVVLIGTKLEQGGNVAEELRGLVERAQLSSKTSITISCGVAEVISSGSALDWLGRADSALYKAKAEGRNRVVLESSAAQ